MSSPDQARDAAALLQKIQQSPYIPEKPYHGPDSGLNHPRQAAFVIAPEKEVLYGGAAGGGKSSALLMAALLHVDQPGYKALILRKNFPQLEMTLMKRCREWLDGTDAQWSAGSKTWNFPSGAFLRFGHMGHPSAIYNYQGSEWDFVGWDELTQFSAAEYEYLFSRLRRREGSQVPIRMRAGTNPGGIGHEWVKQQFLVERKPGERRYIPATLDDNPFLDKVEYEKALAELDPVTREQLRYGRWDVQPSGGWFKQEDFGVFDTTPQLVRLVRFWDMAGTGDNTGGDPDWTVGTLAGADRDGFYYVLDVRRVRAAPAESERLIRATAEQDGTTVEVCMEQEPGSAGLIVADHYRRRVLPGWPYWAERASGSKLDRARPVSSAVAGGLVRIKRAAWNREWLEEFRVFPQEGYHDDQVDSFSGAYSRLVAGHGTMFSQAWEEMAAEAEVVDPAVAVERVTSQTADLAEQNRLLRRLPG